MTLVNNIDKANKLHQLIMAGQTGSPKQLARQLKIDRTTLYLWMDELTELNSAISYSRKYETFYYE